MSYTGWPYPPLPEGPVTAVGIQGDRFTINGKVQHLRGFTDFAGFDVFRRTGQVSPLALQVQQAHHDFVSLTVPALTPRILLMKNKGSHFDLDPREIPDYQDKLKQCAEAYHKKNFLPLWVLLADCNAFGMSLAYQQDFVGKSSETLRASGFPHLQELVNEYDNGPQQVDPSQFSRPAGVLISRGSPGTAGPIPWEAWDFITTRYRRDDKWLQTISDSAYAYRSGTQDGPSAGNQITVPIFDSEPRGAGWRPGRYTSPNDGFALGVESALWNKAAIFHSDSGVVSATMPADELNCAITFLRGMLAATEEQVP